MRIQLKVLWRLGDNELHDLDPLLFTLLEAIEQGGSLRSAAQQAGTSYRHAWGLCQVWEERLGSPLVELRRGRSASLTALGQQFLWAERRVHGRLAPVLDSVAAEVEHDLSALVARVQPLRIVASHDLALGLLRDQLSESGVRVSLQYRGSFDCVRQLASGACDVAGFHFPEGPVGEEIRAAFHRLLHADRFRLFQFAMREQGLILGAGNAAGIRSIRDLARPGVVFVNRQPDSGTRLLFDQLLAAEGLAGHDISGYDMAEFTHLAVAAMVASGMATVGFGVRAAAARFGLPFLPLARERYVLGVANTHPEPHWLTHLLAALRSERFHRSLDEIPGYDTGATGAPVSLARDAG